jgi:hypothetical protein
MLAFSAFHLLQGKIMKPQLRPSEARWLSRYDEISPRRQQLLWVQADFQAPRFGDFFGGGDSPRRRPDFGAFAKEVRADASRRFRLESAMLGLVALVSAWPIAMMILEVIRFLH